MIDLHTLLMNNFEHRVFSIESINTAVHNRCINLGWRVEKTVHCTVLDLPRGKKNVGENRGEMETGCCASRVLLDIPVVHIFTLS